MRRFDDVVATLSHNIQRADYLDSAFGPSASARSGADAVSSGEAIRPMNEECPEGVTPCVLPSLHGQKCRHAGK